MKKITEYLKNLKLDISFITMLLSETFIFFDYVVRANQPNNILMLIVITSTIHHFNKNK